MILVHYCCAVWTEEAVTELRERGGGGLHVVKLLWESRLTNLLNALWAVSQLC